MLKILISLTLLSQILSMTVGIRQSFYVKTSRGILVGQKETNGDYTTFFGVPYAQVEENRPFEKTSEWPVFEQFNASDPNIRCPQVILSEGGILQCLRLNIYVPQDPIINQNSSLPVFVWFHGGGLAFGSAGEYNAKHLTNENVIVITANYRLGPYGFLCTSDIKNQGLEDMKTALKWIKVEIKNFGGDPNKITIGGESWGASAVDFLLYEEADFSQAIMESGSRFSFRVSTRQDNEAPVKLAASLGFNATIYTDAVNFLNTADPIKVMQASRDLGLIFGVCENPHDFNSNNYSKKVANIPILIGYNSKEAFADFATQPEEFYTTLDVEMVNNLNEIFDMSKDELRKLADIIWKFYLGNKTISQDAMLEIIDLSSDFRVNHGAERSVTNYLKLGNSKVYKYLFSFTGGSPFKNMTGVGAYHTEELPYLFEWGTPLRTEEQYMMRKEMIRLWTNFIKHGTPAPTDGDGSWLPSNNGSRQYYNIDVEPQTGMRNHVYQNRMVFWDLIWAIYGQYRK